MTIPVEFPKLDTAAKCAALWPKYPEKVVGIWATGLSRQNVDVLWRLRQELIKLCVPVVFFFNESAKPMLYSLLAPQKKIYTHKHHLLPIFISLTMLGFSNC